MSQPIKVFNTIADFKLWRSTVKGSVGLVPTMGALHSGHAHLLKKIRNQCEFSVLSIFVNPTQFGPNEDFAKYPRTLENDIRIAEQEGADILFAPTATEMYPNNFSTQIEETSLSAPLCGVFRPGHFRGVSTVVLKLFNIVRPQIALFGLKDAQQFFVIRKMVEDLNLDILVQGMPTVREEDGLALSSRNRYLSAEERAKAHFLYQALKSASENLKLHGDADRAVSECQEFLTKLGFKVQYFEYLKLPQVQLIATAAYLGNTRLIDNIILNMENLKNQGMIVK